MHKKNDGRGERESDSLGVEPTQYLFPKSDQGLIANTYHVPHYLSSHHGQRLKGQVSTKVNELYKLGWDSVPELAEGVSVHQDLSEGKVERIKSQLGSSIT